MCLKKSAVQPGSLLAGTELAPLLVLRVELKQRRHFNTVFPVEFRDYLNCGTHPFLESFSDVLDVVSGILNVAIL